MGLSVHDPFVDPLGNPLGLAKVISLLSINPTIVDFINGAAGDFIIPAGFSFFRVTAVGGGAGGTVNGSGGGGGLSRSAIRSVVLGTAISYTAGIGGASGLNGGDSSASFRDVLLYATGGQYVVAASSPGGFGTGGVNNFAGGAGAGVAGGGGGGSAGPSSNGGDGATSGSASSNSVDGGGGGSTGGSSAGGSGGGGVMALGGVRISTSTAINLGGTSKEFWGSAGGQAVTTGAGNGGAWGGGAGRNSSGGSTAIGGYGGVRIELW